MKQIRLLERMAKISLKFAGAIQQVAIELEDSGKGKVRVIKRRRRRKGTEALSSTDKLARVGKVRAKGRTKGTTVDPNPSPQGDYSDRDDIV